MENYTITVPATSQPVTLAEAKAFMKVTHSVEDSLITALIVAATQAIENYTGQYFVERTVKGEFSNLFISNTELYPYVKIRRAPLKSVTSVKVSIDSSFEDESFQVKKPTHGFARILFDELTASMDDIPYPLEIIFIAGYGADSDVPENIKLAIKEYVNYLHKNRGDCGGSEFPIMVKVLLAPFKIIEVFA